MTGSFCLKTADGSLDLRFTKRVFYDFEKRHKASFLSSFVAIDEDGSLKANVLGLLRIDVLIDLAFLAQVKQPPLSIRELIDKADEVSLQEMAAFAVQEYIEVRGLATKKDEGTEENPPSGGTIPTS